MADIRTMIDDDPSPHVLRGVGATALQGHDVVNQVARAS
jgi:hypothetical protein